MGEGIANMIKSKEGKIAFLVLGGIVLVLSGINHYHNIKLNRLKIKEAEAIQTNK
jgi:hypothetical protein